MAEYYPQQLSQLKQYQSGRRECQQGRRAPCPLANARQNYPNQRTSWAAFSTSIQDPRCLTNEAWPAPLVCRDISRQEQLHEVLKWMAYQSRSLLQQALGGSTVSECWQSGTARVKSVKSFRLRLRSKDIPQHIDPPISLLQCERLLMIVYL